MTILIDLRDRMKEIYANYSAFILPVCRFFLAFAVLRYLNHTLAYLDILDNLYLILILSLLCALLPVSVLTAIAMLVILGHCFGLSPVVAAVAFVALLLLWILFLRFTPGYGLAMVLTPLAFGLHIPAVIPIGFGLAGEPVSAIAVACGVALQYFLQTVTGSIADLVAREGVSMVEIGQGSLQALVKNQEMLLSVIVCAIVVLVVNGIRRLSVDYAWQASVVIGGVAYAVLMIAGAMFLELPVQTVPLLAGTAGSCLIGMILQFFLFGADYAQSEHFQFSDDEYYYYVKAVPLYAAREDEDEEEEAFPDADLPRRRAERMLQGVPDEEPAGQAREGAYENVDFEARLEATLKDL